MANQVTLYQTPLPPAAEQRGTSPEAWHVLKTVLYPGAGDEIVCTILDYCRARDLDPLKKPFHIVPVWDSKLKREVEGIWPSIGETRITAMRTGEYAGMRGMDHGEEVTRRFGSVEITFPLWAQCTVYRMIGGTRCEFVGPKVYWLETFAKAQGGAPNRMWQQRPFGQLDKCAEAAALRAAFPEEAGTTPTAEEMEGQAVHFGPSGAKLINAGPERGADLDGPIRRPEQIGTLDDLVTYAGRPDGADGADGGSIGPDEYFPDDHDPETGEVFDDALDPPEDEPPEQINPPFTIVLDEDGRALRFSKRSEAYRALFEAIVEGDSQLQGNRGFVKPLPSTQRTELASLQHDLQERDRELAAPLASAGRNGKK